MIILQIKAIYHEFLTVPYWRCPILSAGMEIFYENGSDYIMLKGLLFYFCEKDLYFSKKS